jgi:hypothetical protein
MPRGPREVRMASATAFAASMFIVRTSFFFELSLWVGWVGWVRSGDDEMV